MVKGHVLTGKRQYTIFFKEKEFKMYFSHSVTHFARLLS